MKTKLTIFAGALLVGVSLQAGTAFTSSLVMTSNGGATVSAFPATLGQNSTQFQGVEVSPYTGTIATQGVNGGNAQSITLFCVDYQDEINPGSTYTVNVTAVNGLVTNPLVNATQGSMANTRDGSGNEAAGYPTGTTLYEEEAWLATQMMSSGQTVSNEETIQEAMWVMTNPTNASAITANPTSGTYQTYQNWIWDAEDAVGGKCVGTGCVDTAGSYATPNYSNWLILTLSTGGGSEIGSSCLTTSNCSSSGMQELLAFTGSSAPTATPEPASFFLIGSGLVFASFVGRRRKSQASNG